MPKALKLASFDPSDSLHYRDKEHCIEAATAASERIAAMQGRFIMDGSRAVLIVLQGTDASGKDGSTRAIVGALNPMGVTMTGFKVPSTEERAHDFLWRIHRALPARGTVGVFNRSHYEDIVAVRVEKIAPKAVWKPRYAAVNAFEAHLAAEGTAILKFMLVISKDEQLKRLEERRTDPAKMWKFSSSDFDRRERWDEYVAAYQDVLDKTSTEAVPWHVVPADHKWVRNAFILETIADAFDGMNLPPAAIRTAR